MIKHSKVRLLEAGVTFTFVLSLGIFATNTPTIGVENKSVNEQVCNQLEVEENTVFVTGTGHNNFTSVIPVPNLSEIGETETNRNLQTLKYKDGWLITNVNVRQEPSTDSEILELYIYNTKINYAEYDEEWAIIKYNDGYAFMAKEFISDAEMPEYIPEEEIAIPAYSGTKLTRQLGTVMGPNGKETYYNLPMSVVIKYMKDLGYNYNYWVRSDGCKMYGEYIMLAADTNIRPKGTILKTSLGLGIVCDHCEASESYPGQIDIAVTWQ